MDLGIFHILTFDFLLHEFALNGRINANMCLYILP